MADPISLKDSDSRLKFPFSEFAKAGSPKAPYRFRTRYWYLCAILLYREVSQFQHVHQGKKVGLLEGLYHAK